MLTDSDIQTFLEGEENQIIERKTESYVLSGFGNGISGSWEQELTTGRFVTGWFGHVPEMFSSASKDPKSITENFLFWKLFPLFVFKKFQHIFLSWASVPIHFTTFIWGWLILLFSFINKVDFSCQESAFVFI